MTTVMEMHESLEQSTLYQIETIIGTTPRWVVLDPKEIKISGKFIIYSPTYVPFTRHTARVLNQHGFKFTDSFTFSDEAVAIQLAKALSHVWDRPLRVMKVQRIRIGKQIGKVILPVGGV